MRDAIATYHDLLTDSVASETFAQLDAQQRSRGLFFGDRPLCTVLRPRFLDPAQYRWLQHRAAILLHAFDRAHRKALADPLFRRQFGLLAWEERLVTIDPDFEARPLPPDSMPSSWMMGLA